MFYLFKFLIIYILFLSNYNFKAFNNAYNKKKEYKKHIIDNHFKKLINLCQENKLKEIYNFFNLEDIDEKIIYKLLIKKDKNNHNLLYYLFKYNNIDKKLLDFLIDKIKKYNYYKENNNKRSKIDLLEFFNTKKYYFHEDSPFFIALKNKQFECCKLMLENCNDLLQIKDESTDDKKQYNDFFDYISKNRGNLNNSNFYSNGNNIFMHIVMFADKDFLEFVIKLLTNQHFTKYNENKKLAIFFNNQCRNLAKESPLMLASGFNNDEEIVDLLRKYNANIHLKDKKKRSILFYSTINKNTKIFNKLISKDFYKKKKPQLSSATSDILSYSIKYQNYELFNKIIEDKKILNNIIKNLLNNNYESFIEELIKIDRLDLIKKIFFILQRSEQIIALINNKNSNKGSFTPFIQAIFKDIQNKDDRLVKIFTSHPKFSFNSINKNSRIYNPLKDIFKNEHILNKNKLELLEYVSNKIVNNNNIKYYNFNINNEIKKDKPLIIYFLKSISKSNKYDIDIIFKLLFLIDKNNKAFYNKIDKYIIAQIKSLYKFYINKFTNNLYFIDICNKRQFVCIALLLFSHFIDCNELIKLSNNISNSNIFIEKNRQFLIFINSYIELANLVNQFNKYLFYCFDQFFQNHNIINENSYIKLISDIFENILINIKNFNYFNLIIPNTNNFFNNINNLSENNSINKSNNLFILLIYSLLIKFNYAIEPKYRKYIIENIELESNFKYENVHHKDCIIIFNLINKILKENNRIKELYNNDDYDYSKFIINNSFKILDEFEEEYMINNISNYLNCFDPVNFLKNIFNGKPFINKFIGKQKIKNINSNTNNNFNLYDFSNQKYLNYLKDKEEYNNSINIDNQSIQKLEIYIINLAYINSNNILKYIDLKEDINKFINRLKIYNIIIINLDNNNNLNFSTLGKIAFNIYHHEYLAINNDNNINKILYRIINQIKKFNKIDSIEGAKEIIKNNILFLYNKKILFIIVPNIKPNIIILNKTLLSILLQLVINNLNDKLLEKDKFIVKDCFYSSFNNSNNMIIKCKKIK